MFVQNLVMSCWSCLNGHRAKSCQHVDRPLYALKNKGRPSPQTRTRTKAEPDVPCLEGLAFIAFHSSVMNDPILRKEYYHADNVQDKSLSKRPRVAPYVKRERSKSATIEDIYAG